MSGYVLANVSWANEEERQAYLEPLGPSLDAHGGVATTTSQDVHVMEGDWEPDGVMVLITFPQWRAHWRGTTPRSTARRLRSANGRPAPGC